LPLLTALLVASQWLMMPTGAVLFGGLGGALRVQGPIRGVGVLEAAMKMPQSCRPRFAAGRLRP
jgi:hypothetical protein